MKRTSRRAGAYRRPAFFLAIALAAAAAASCYSSGYRSEMRASVALISDLSDKLADYCRSGFELDSRRVSSEEMGEFYYGLQKARAYESMTRSQQERRSQKKFAELVDAYEKFVRDADRYRLDSSRPPEQLDGLLKDHDTVAQLAQAVTTALDSEPK